MKLSILLATCWGEIAITSGQVAFGAAGFALGISLCLLLLSWRHGRFDWAPLYGAVLLLHPSWWMNVEAGDCGLAMRFLSIMASLTLAAILICQVFWPGLSRRRFLLTLGLVSWAAYLVLWPLNAILSDLWQFPAPNGGVAAQAFLSWMEAGNDLLTISLALTLASFVQGVFAWTRRLHLPQAAFPGQRSLEHALIDQEQRNSEHEASSQSRSRLRVLCIVVLLALIALYVSSLILRPDIGQSTILAFGWSVILIIAAIRGKFPGWSIDSGRASTS